MESNFTIRPIVNCLPAWFRFAQCLRRYRDSKEAFPHLVNAGKYATTFFVVIFATLRAYHASEYATTFDNPYTTLWLLSQAISSTYAYTWDIKMDWGLFDRNAGENKFLREEIVYSSTVSFDYIKFAWELQLKRIFFSFTGILLFRDHRRLCVALCMECRIHSHRVEIHFRRFVDIYFGTARSIPTIRVEFLPIGERASEQLRQIQSGP